MTEIGTEMSATIPTPTTAQSVAQGNEPDFDFDDGLVHDHGWACQERGAPAN